VYALTLGWLAKTKEDDEKPVTVFHPLVDGESFEICQGFQGGTHLGIAIDLKGYDPTEDAALLEVYALVWVDGVPVGGTIMKHALFKMSPEGTLRSGTVKVFIEPCKGGILAGYTALVEVLVRDENDDWGFASITLQLIDEVDGYYFDPEGQWSCL
jgi:hypothetical protein